jgi:hypothetical protein
MVNFIGIGAQKSGTSWVYACLYEHPEVCIPVKEIHFFSRARFSKGKDWYESHFKLCKSFKKRGEYSTSYLYSHEAAKNIYSYYPNVALIVVLREPVSRAYSQYRNAIRAGEVEKKLSFDEYIDLEPSCIAQGLYYKQLKLYYDIFNEEQILVIQYEDMTDNPKDFIQLIYKHIGVDERFVPRSLETKINIARTPRYLFLDSIMHRVAEFLRIHGAGMLVHQIKCSGVTDSVRRLNTVMAEPDSLDLNKYKKYFLEDVKKLDVLLNKNFSKKWIYD